MNKKFMMPAFLAGGVLAMVLRLMVYRTAQDASGLLLPGSPWAIVLWCLTAAAAAAALALGRGAELCTGRWAQVLGCAAMLAAAVWSQFRGASADMPVLLVLQRVCGILACLSLAAHLVQLLLGRRPVFGTWAVLCVFLCVNMVVEYRHWNNQPQLMDYAFSLLAMLCLCLAAYHRAAETAGMPRARTAPAVILLGIFLCLAALPYALNPMLLAAGCVWLVLGGIPEGGRV